MSMIGNQSADKLLTSADLDPAFVLPVAQGGTGQSTAGTATFNAFTQTLTNKTMAAATNTIEARSGPDSSAFSFRNKLINGAFDIAQRGATYALTTTIAYGGPDRWAHKMNSSAAGIANQVASGLSTFPFCLKLGRTAASSLTGFIATTQVLETKDSVQLQGKQVTLSYYAKAGANYSQAASSLQVFVGSGTGTDETSISFLASTWAGFTSVVNVTHAITTSWVRYTYTGTVPANATQIGVQFYYSPTGTAGADDNFYITGVQLEAGQTATPFETRPYGVELALCQRYCVRWSNTVANTLYLRSGTGFASNRMIYPAVELPVFPRTSPTVTHSGVLGYDASFSLTGSVSTITVFNSAGTAVDLDIAFASGVSTGSVYSIALTASTGYLQMAMEL